MRKKYYPSRDGGFRRWNSYSVGYSEALQRGLIPDNKTNRNKYPQVFDKEPGYFGWIQNADFPLYTKKVLTGIKLRKLNTK